MQIRVLSNDEAFIHSLSVTADPALKPDVGVPSFVPGAVESWWTLLVNIGAVGLPVGIVGNLIASWIWQAVHHPREPQITTLNLAKPSKVKLVLSRGHAPRWKSSPTISTPSVRAWSPLFSMSLSSSELIALLRGTLPGAAPAERASIETYIDFIDRQGVTARQDSEKSQFLKRTATDFEAFWQPEVASSIQGIELYGVDMPLINAFARLESGCRQIILFEGIQQVAIFYAHLITVLNLLNRLRPDRYIDIDGWREKEAASFSLAGFSLLYEYMKTGQVLIAVGDILGPNALQNTELGYVATIAFLLAHELGHLMLGHTGPSGTIAERNQVSLAIEEDINTYQENEFAADRYALFAFREHLRLPLMSSVIFFFGPMAFMEAFLRPHNLTHPLFTNRAAHLASLLPSDGKDAIAVANIIESQIAGFKRVTAMRGEAEDDIRPRIHQTMPVDLAYRVIHAVKEAVTSEIGFLDVENETPDTSRANP